MERLIENKEKSDEKADKDDENGYSTAMTPALAQNCTSPTRCDELGYKKSAADCDGMESLVCPFDSSKYFCHDKDDCDKLGYTKSAEACNGLESLVCPSDNSKYFCVLKEKPGLIYYSDGSFSYDLEDGKTPVGIIAYIKDDTKLLISLEENSLEFSTGYEDVSCLENHGTNDLAGALADFNGKENTLCMVNYEGKFEYPAAEWCNSFSASDSGIGSSGWYLPAAGELYAMIDNYDAINNTLKKLKSIQFTHNYYQVSTEATNNYAWRLRPSDGFIYNYYKSEKRLIRCFLNI